MTIPSALCTIAARAPGFQPQIAVILGSGWGGLTDLVDDAVRFPYSDLEGFPSTSIKGHEGQLVLGTLGGRKVAVMSGRKHGYETGAVNGMQTPLALLHEMGCHLLVQTNASGSLRVDLLPNSLMVLSDHINFAQRSPLVGASGSERFVSMVDAYDPDLRAQAIAIAAQGSVPLQTGVYAWAFGPQFETPAEIRMFAQLGADIVGMSTVPETIIARHLGMRVLALSLVTNMGAGLSDEVLSHAHTLAQAQREGQAGTTLLANIIARLNLSPPTPLL